MLSAEILSTIRTLEWQIDFFAAVATLNYSGHFPLKPLTSKCFLKQALNVMPPSGKLGKLICKINVQHISKAGVAERIMRRP